MGGPKKHRIQTLMEYEEHLSNISSESPVSASTIAAIT